jgi:hypothetical protein
MTLRPSSVLGAVLAASGVVFAALLVVGVSAAAAGPGPYIFRFNHVTTGPASTPAVVVLAATFAVIACAVILSAVLTMRNGHRALTAQVTPLPVDGEQQQTRKAA